MLRQLFLQAAAVLVPHGKPYIVDSENKDAVNQLLYYFNSDSSFTGSLNCGLMLQGNVGSGKSCLMRIFQLLNLKPLVYKPCREVATEFMDKGFAALKTYSKAVAGNPGETKYVVYCFDDLGAEDNLKSWGNEVNVMAEIIQDRYERWKSFGTVTHFTTNLTRSEIEARYGDRILSRLQEMNNFITLGNGSNSTDRRISKR